MTNKCGLDAFFAVRIHHPPPLKDDRFDRNCRPLIILNVNFGRVWLLCPGACAWSVWECRSMLLRVKERSREFFCFSLSEKRHFKAKKPPDKVNDYGDKVNDCRTKWTITQQGEQFHQKTLIFLKVFTTFLIYLFLAWIFCDTICVTISCLKNLCYNTQKHLCKRRNCLLT